MYIAEHGGGGRHDTFSDPSITIFAVIGADGKVVCMNGE